MSQCAASVLNSLLHFRGHRRGHPLRQPRPWGAVGLLASCTTTLVNGEVSVAATAQHEEPGGFAAASVSCPADGIEDWPDLQRRVFRLLDGGATAGALVGAMGRAIGAQLHSGDTESKHERRHDCVPGLITLRFLAVLLSPGDIGAEQMSLLLGAEWRIMGDLGWPAVVRSGWPIFRLMRLLQRRAVDVSEPTLSGAILPGCGNLEEDEFSELLLRHVRHRKPGIGDNLLASSASYLMNYGRHQATEGVGGCQLSKAAAYLANAWARYPVYDSETAALLHMTQRLVVDGNVTLLHLIAIHRHALLDMLDDVAGVYQAFLVDSGAFYQDLRRQKVDEPAVDYSRHMDTSSSTVVGADSGCMQPSARTPRGRCNYFAPLAASLSPWKKFGIAREDTHRAVSSAQGRRPHLRAAYIRWSNAGLQIVVLNTDAPNDVDDLDHVVECVAEALTRLFSRTSDIRRFDAFLSLAQEPLVAGQAADASSCMRRSHQSQRDEVPPPVFSFCGSSDSWDIPLPAMCRSVTCIRTKDSGESSSPPHHPMFEEAKPESDDSVQCYLFRLLQSYVELLKYEVEDTDFAHPLPGQGYTYTFDAPPKPTAHVSQRFAQMCMRLVKEASQ